MSRNEFQERAVTWDGDLIVSAGAGAGKTTVLTDRVIRLMLEGIGLDEMLILTFTRAAAAQMKNRIETALTDAEQKEADPKKKQYLQRQLLLCPNASISTIDSFCASVVCRHYYRVDLAPGMGTVTNTEQAILLDEAIDEACAGMAQEEPEPFHILLRSFNGAPNVKNTVLRLHTFLCAQPDRDQWLTDTEADCRAGRLTVAAEEKLIKKCSDVLGADIRALAAITKELRRYEPVYDKYVQYATGLIQQLSGTLLMQTAAAYGESLAAAAIETRLPTVTAKNDTAGMCAPFKHLRDNLIKTVKEQRSLFSNAGEEETGNEAVTRIVEALLALLRRAEALFSAKKLEKGKIDYADMEYYAVKLLAIPEVAAEYRDRFRTVIVDEYQDSNRLQEKILDSIRRPGGLFLVGDVKQSIYGFRNAEPELFNDKVRRYKDGTEGRLIPLNFNYRSSEEVLFAVNGVFERLMTPETGELEYGEDQKLRSGIRQPEGKAVLAVIDCKQSEDAAPDEELGNAEAEALCCVEQIRRIMKEETYTDRKGVSRPYTYRDFTVLLRSRTAAPQMVRIFTEEGIPCYAESGGGYFRSIEVQLFLNILRIIDNRRQDIPLLSVMRSMVGGFSDEELIALRQLCPEKGKEILDCLLTGAEQTPGGKADLFLQKLEAWRRMSLYLPAGMLCSLLLDETGLLREMSMLPGGRQREANLREVVTLANEYDASGAFSLHGFLRFADKASEKDKLGTVPTVTGDVVQIMTVHGSKGLEFPVVFYCDLGRDFNDRDLKKDLLLDGELGIGLRYTDEGHIKRTPRLFELLKKRISDKEREEEMRILYVGMTRAERQLYMVGSVKDLEKKREKLPAHTSAADIRNASNPLTWLLLTENDALRIHYYEKGVFVRGQAVQPALEKADTAALSVLEHRLSRVYPYPAPAGVPDKTSATALSGAEKVYEFSETPFTGRTKTDTAETSALRHGTDIHALLQRLPLAPEEGAARGEMLTPLPERDRSSLAWFLGTELFRRMQLSPLCRRELPFTAAVESGTLSGLAAGEQVLLQGVIDCCFLEDGAYVVLDYKTDAFRGSSAAEQAETHREQVALYARVLSELTGKPVKEQYVVFITEKEIVRL